MKVKFEVTQLERRTFTLNRLGIIYRTIGGGSSLEFQMWQEIRLWATLYIHSLLGILFKRLLKMMIISIYAYIATKFSIYFLIVFHDQFFIVMDSSFNTRWLASGLFSRTGAFELQEEKPSWGITGFLQIFFFTPSRETNHLGLGYSWFYLQKCTHQQGKIRRIFGGPTETNAVAQMCPLLFPWLSLSLLLNS